MCVFWLTRMMKNSDCIWSNYQKMSCLSGTFAWLKLIVAYSVAGLRFHLPNLTGNRTTTLPIDDSSSSTSVVKSATP